MPTAGGGAHFRGSHFRLHTYRCCIHLVHVFTKISIQLKIASNTINSEISYIIVMTYCYSIHGYSLFLSLVLYIIYANHHGVTAADASTSTSSSTTATTATECSTDAHDNTRNYNYTCSVDENYCEIPMKYDYTGADKENDSVISRGEILEILLAGEAGQLDKTYDETVAELKRRGAHRCWHKHSDFLQHLTGVSHTLKLWMLPEAGDVMSDLYARVGLLHSAYSNSYVNLALFDPANSTERLLVQQLIGREAEEVIYLFCNIDRQSIVVDTLLKHGMIPKEGLDVPHLRDGVERMIHLEPSLLQLLVTFTMADISDQYFGWQDELFGYTKSGGTNSMLFPDEDKSMHYSKALWPGYSKPGLWVSYVSSLCSVAKTYTSGFLPPVFNYCENALSVEDEVKARDMYWSVVTSSSSYSDVEDDYETIEILKTCISLNPWVFEPYVMIAQKYFHVGELDEAKEMSEKALNLQQMWGFPWDKRLGFSAWVAWTRVLNQRASRKQEWPMNSWEVNNFGLVE